MTEMTGNISQSQCKYMDKNRMMLRDMIVRKDDSLIERLVLAHNAKRGVAVTNAKNAVHDSREGSP